MKDELLPNTSARPWDGGRNILLATLSELGLPRRLQNALQNWGCTLVGQLVQIREDELIRIPDMGIKTVDDTQRMLSHYSLELGTVLPFWDQALALEERSRIATELGSEAFGLDPEAPSPQDMSEILIASLDEAGLPQRLVNQLPKHGCQLVGQLVQWSEDRLYRLNYLGSGSISDAKIILQRFSLTFGMHIPDWDDATAFARREAMLAERAITPATAKLAIVSPDVSEEILLASLEEIGLPKRLLNHLPGRGCNLVGQLIQKTEAELFRLPNLGRKSVYEARTILASHSLSFGLTVPGWNDNEAIARRETLGVQIRQALFDATGEADDTDDFIEDEARRALESVEEKERNVAMLLSLLGFDGLPPKTLETVGQINHLTRERVRQIGERAQVRFSTKWRPTPRLEAAMQLLLELEPTGATRFSDVLIGRGIARGRTHPQAILEFAGFVGKKHAIRRCMIGSDEVYCSAQSEALVRRCAIELRRATSSMGCTSLDRLAVCLDVPLQETSRVQAMLEILSETVWLGRGRNWVMSTRPTRNRVINMAEKIFAVTETITLPELRRCLSRSYRLATVPAADALTDLLELKGLAVGEWDSVRRLRECSTDCLGSIELPFFLAFRDHGSPLSREQLEDICIDEYGVHPTSFWIYLSYSPIVMKLAPGVYSLAGADVPAGAVEDVRLRTKTAQKSSEFGWTQNGQLWCVSQLDRISVRTGNHAIPAYVAKLTAGVWTCVVSGGLPAGDVTIENGFARGLVLAFGLAGAENGDLARLTFDLQRRSVELRVGGSELTEDIGSVPMFDEEAEDDPELDLDDDPPPSGFR